jgi:hypothetical protein
MNATSEHSIPPRRALRRKLGRAPARAGYTAARMACFRGRHTLALAVALGWACGTVEPVFPLQPTAGTGSDSDACTPQESDASASSGGAADTTGSTGGDAPEPRPDADDGCESTSGECVPGAEGCPCTKGDACNPGLMCISEVCVQDECPIGTDGCPCTQGGGCDPDLTCVDDVCS